MKPNLFELYQQTEGFKKRLHNSRPGSHVLNFARRAMGEDSKIFSLKNPENTIEVSVSDSLYIMHVYRPDRTLEEKHLFNPRLKNPLQLVITAYDSKGKIIKSEKAYNIEGEPAELAIAEEKTFTAGGAPEDKSVWYDKAYDGKIDIVKEEKYFPGTTVIQEKTEYDAFGNIKTHFVFDEKKRPVIQEFFHKFSNALKAKNTYFRDEEKPHTITEHFDDSGKYLSSRIEYVDGKIASKQYFHEGSEVLHVSEKYTEDGALLDKKIYREDGTLFSHVEMFKNDRTITKFYEEDGKTMKSSEEKKGKALKSSSFYEPIDPDNSSAPPLIKSRILYNDSGNAFKYIFYRTTAEGISEIIGERDIDPKTDRPISEFSIHPETGERFEYRYNPETGKKIREKRYGNFFSADEYSGDTLSSAPDLPQNLQEDILFHPDGKTPRIKTEFHQKTEFDDEEKPRLRTGYYKDGSPRSTQHFDEDGRIEAHQVVAQNGEDILYEGSYTDGRRTSETLNLSLDPHVKSIEKEAFYPSGRIKLENVSYHNGDKAELFYYDQSPPQVASETLCDKKGDTKVRRFYDRNGNITPSKLDESPGHTWKNRIEVAKQKSVFSRPSRVLLTDVSEGLESMGSYERKLTGKVSLLLQGDEEQLLNAKRKIEKILPDAEAALEKRTQLGDKPGDYYDGKYTYGKPQKDVHVLKVVLPYSRADGKAWPQEHYSLGSSGPASVAFTELVKDATRKLIDMLKKVHSYTGCDLGLQIQDATYKQDDAYTPKVTITYNRGAIYTGDSFLQEIVMAVVAEKMNKSPLGASWNSHSFSLMDRPDAKEEATHKAHNLAKIAARMLNVPKEADHVKKR